MLTDADLVLLDRIRPMMKRRKGVSEKKMFGGICFLINGNMCVGTWKGSLVVRLDKEKHEQTQAEPHAKPMDITGKVMKGWALVQPAGVKADDDLKAWVVRAASRSAPSRAGPPARRRVRPAFACTVFDRCGARVRVALIFARARQRVAARLTRSLRRPPRRRQLGLRRYSQAKPRGRPPR